MATKLQKMSELAAQTTKQLTHSIDEWLGFLDSAAWLYKYPFHEQVLIHAQRPDAKACAPIELWNNTFRRWVNKGAKGIALIDDSGAKPSLRYVFDVSDTNARHNIPFRLWEMQAAREGQIVEELANHFGEIDAYTELPFSDQITGIVHNAVNDNLPDYANDLMRSLDGSALDEYDDFNIKVWLEQIVEMSVAYCVLTRLGFDAREYFEREDFQPVLDFDTPAVITQLGTATADISEMVLRQIERSVRSIERQERGTLAKAERVLQNEDRKDERSAEHGTDLQPERGLSDSRYRDGRAADGADRQIRKNEESVSQRESQGDVQSPAADGRADSAPAGDRQDGERASREVDERDGERRERDGEPESLRSDGVGAADEQHQAPSRGSGDSGDRSQLTLLPTAEEQIAEMEQAEAETASAFSVSQADLDNELVRGSGFSQGKLRIYKFYQSQPDTNNAVKFLKKEYGIGGHSHTYLDGSSGFVDHDGKGLSFANRHYQDRQQFTWTAIHKRIGELIALDRYLTEKEKAAFPAWEQEEAEKQLQRAEEAAVRETLRAAAAAMDERRKGAEYRFSLGDEVQLGAQTYAILGYDDETVMLSSPRFPLLSEEMPREVFERRLRENEANDHLIVEETAQETPAPVNVNSIDDMTQLDREEALQLFDEGELIYLYDIEHQTEVIAATREDIENFDGVLTTDAFSDDEATKIEEARSLINAYCLEEFEEEANFEDLAHIGLAYTTSEDGSHEFAAEADLIGLAINRYIDRQLVESRSYDSLDELCTQELEGLDFGEDVYKRQVLYRGQRPGI